MCNCAPLLCSLVAAISQLSVLIGQKCNWLICMMVMRCVIQYSWTDKLQLSRASVHILRILSLGFRDVAEVSAQACYMCKRLDLYLYNIFKKITRY